MIDVTPDALRRVPIFEDQSEEDLQWLIDVSTPASYAADERPFKPGDPATSMIIVLEGEVQIFSHEGGRPELYNTFGAGTVTGLLPYSRMEVYGGEGIVRSPTTVLLVEKARFPEMLDRMPDLGQRLTAIMSDRVRETARMEQQREKMVSLGKLAAGLAHELNNPAAAVRRTAEALQETMGDMPRAVVEMAQCGAQPLAIERAGKQKAIVQARGRPSLSALERSDCEDELADWLAVEGGLEDVWEPAEAFCEAGFTVDDFETIVHDVAKRARPPVIQWLYRSLVVDQMAADLREASARISDLVGAVKSYTHMDRAPDPEAVDIHEGLEQTLKILGAKLRGKSIHVERVYDADLPRVTVLSGALNQVWTNLIDNAIDAMESGGTLTLKTEQGGLGISVSVIDDGVGIPPDVQSRIFEPFFTTKEVGDGTGLGLDIAHRIVTRTHQGDLSVHSAPGRTQFTVQLPIHFVASPPASAGEVVH
jgi:signal transduction histidine kinase